MMYPLLFSPIYKEMVWGGTRLKEKYGRQLPGEKIGESWDISCRPKEMGMVEKGPWTGRLFEEVIEEDKRGILGSDLETIDDFPILVKIIDAKDNLSVQVHPDDTYAREVENYVFGKTEMWCVLDAPKDAELIIGLKEGVTKETFAKAIEDGDVEACLGRLPIKVGDVINIPAGLVHAITAGVMLAEIQQNSDITYRVYDYNRVGLDGKPRELHVEKSLDVIDFDGKLSKEVLQGLSVKEENSNNEITYFIENQYFAVERYKVDGSMAEKTDGERFVTYTYLSGEGNAPMNIVFKGEKTVLEVGRSIFIPAGLGEYTLEGKGELLKSYVPSANKEHQFLAKLKALGFSEVDIRSKTDCL